MLINTYLGSASALFEFSVRYGANRTLIEGFKSNGDSKGQDPQEL